MKPIVIFTHVVCEPPGYIKVLIDDLGYPSQQICLLEQDIDESIIQTAAGIVFMGGPGNVNDPTHWMETEMQIIQQADRLGIPMLGICLGAQLMSKAMGGEVREGRSLEVGWHPVKLLDEAKSHSWFEQLPETFLTFQWHAHVVTPPPGAITVAMNECTDCQAYIDGHHLALQFHLEMHENTIRSLIDQYGSDLEEVSGCVQSRSQILQGIQAKTERVFVIADNLLVRWFRSLYD